MLNKIASCRHTLQQNRENSSVKSRRKCHGGLTANQHSTYKRVRRAIHSGDGVCDWDVARLAASCGISERQFNRDLAVIVARGLILKIERRLSGRRNDTNLLMLPALASSRMGDKNVGEKQKLLELKPTTPALENPRAVEPIPPAEPERPSPTRQQWEARRAQDREDRHRMRDRYDTLGRAWLAKAEERTRMAMRACVGMNTAPIEPMSDDRRRELEAEDRLWEVKQAEKRAVEAEAKERAAEARRIELEWLEAHREGCETCKGSGVERYIQLGVIKSRECKHGGMMEA